ncbi:hypothetical protein [Acidianus bottle-shaped virus 3 strain ABV3]|uniref:Uncharacterized protein n=1 Tax=Acidianus bottle-shaped virus 3 strain ABV3 TaxID=1732174 RepID=A0A0N9NJI7_9VIRU|nr:hypothetical protein AVU00_gp09 [Acidianus bottle-shaped virus 3 strain ABV3]ALG96811.1 hypothetical protein [Acidianus bottle-shaped virus 3 strain ABV3]
MKESIIKVIPFNKDLVFSINLPYSVYLNDKYLTTIDADVDLNKFEKALLTDEKLKVLMNKYLVAETLSQIYSQKEQELVKKLNEQILHSFIYDYKDLSGYSSDVKREKRDKYLCFTTENFEVCTHSKKYELSAIVNEISDALKNVDSSLKLTIYYGKYSLTIFINSIEVYRNDAFALRDVLSYFRDEIKEGKLNEVINLLKQLKEIKEKQLPATDYFLRISDRIKEIAFQCKE